MSEWYLSNDIQAELSTEWFDKPEIVAELQLDPDMIRQDFTMKSNQGYLGQIKDNEGYTMTEQSIDVEVDGKKVLMPLLVPGLNNDEISAIRANESNDNKFIQSAYKKAEEHGKQRIKEGKSPFFEDKPQSITLDSDEVPIGNVGKEVKIDNTPDARLNKINTLLQQKGYSKEAIAGIIGNIKQESGAGDNSYNFNVQQSNGGGYGIFQLDFMKPYYKKYLEEKDKTDSIESQIDYMDDVVNNRVNMLKPEDAKKLKEGLANAKTPEEAAKLFMEIFEKPGKPHLENRIKYANEYYSK